MTRTFFCRLALPLCGLLFSGHLFAAEGDKPLLQEGKKTLYQRILTTPGCKLSDNAGDENGRLFSLPLAAFMFIKRKRLRGKAGLKSGRIAMAKPLAGCRNPVP